MDRIHLLIWASALVDTGSLAAGVYWALRGGVPRALRAAALLAAMAAVKLALLLALGLDVPFGVAHVLYLDLVVVLPVAGLVLALGRGARPGRRVAGAGLVLLAPLGAYASFVEPSRVVLERTEVALAPDRGGEAPVTIGVLSDLQFREVGDQQREAVARVMRERPDVIVLPGDLQQGGGEEFERTLPEVRRLLGRLRAPGGVYFVIGDVEGLGKARLQLARTGVRLLLNRTATVRVRDRTVVIGGTELDYGSPGARRMVEGLEEDPGESDIRVLLTHRPDSALALQRETRVDLVIAGHTHGGQIQLPLLGPLTVASEVSRSVGAGGLHDVGGERRLYVSRGIGLERGQAPPVRFGAPPEVSLLRLD